MSQGMFSDTLIRLEALKRIFVFRPKIDVFPRGRSRVFNQNLWGMPDMHPKIHPFIQ